MMRRPARLAAVLLLLGVLFPTRQQPIAGGGRVDEQQPTAGAVEVRLRKLHLVRPDLIPYPIAYEVCC